MAAVRQTLAELAEKLGLNGPLLERARSRYGLHRKRTKLNHREGMRVQREADQLRRSGNLEAARKADEKAARCHHRAYRSHLKAQIWLGRIKALKARIDGLEEQQEQAEAELKELRKEVKFKINKATGGTARQRLRATALESAKRCAAGRRRNFYSMTGAWDVGHCLTGESYGERSDCSSWVTSVYKSCGLKDPNGEDFNGGYTGTLGAHGRKVSRENLKPGDLVFYGPAPHHHVEMYVGPGDKTIGHGSAPVDPGVIDLFGDGDFVLRSYV